MKIATCAQRSDEWRALRAGRITASRAKDVLAKIKTGEAADRRNYRMQILAERLTGIPQDSDYINGDMQWGIDHEDAARNAYEVRTGVLVHQVGLVMHDGLPVAASPDGLIDADGCSEIKCPRTTTHIGYLSAGRCPPEYIAQVQMQLWIAERQWCDFVSFDPRLPAKLQLFVHRVQRDDEYIKTLESEIVKFSDEVDAEIARLEALTDPLLEAA